MMTDRDCWWESLAFGALTVFAVLLALALLALVCWGAIEAAGAFMRWLAGIHPVLLVPGAMCMTIVVLAAAEKVVR